MPVRRAVRRGMRRTARRTSRRMLRRRAVVGGMVTVGLASGSMAKMSQADAQKVEQETGKKLEDMSEEELEAAEEKLGITEQEITDADEAALTT